MRRAAARPQYLQADSTPSQGPGEWYTYRGALDPLAEPHRACPMAVPKCTFCKASGIRTPRWETLKAHLK